MVSRGLVFLLFIVFIGFAGAALAGDMVVIASTAPDIKAGQVFKSGAALDVPAGAEVTLITEAGTPMTLAGPRSGPVEAGGGGADGGNLVASLSGLLTGAGKETGELGTMRAAKPPEAPDDPWVVDITRSGNHCVNAGRPVKLWRSKAGRKTKLSLRNLTDRSKSSVSWPAGAATVDWPEKVTLEDGAKFMARLKGSVTASRLTIFVAPGNLQSDAYRVVWMAKFGCVQQAKQLLAKIR